MGHLLRFLFLITDRDEGSLYENASVQSGPSLCNASGKYINGPQMHDWSVGVPVLSARLYEIDAVAVIGTIVSSVD